MSTDLFWIPGPWRGRLAVASRPRGGDWIVDEARGWRRAGVDVVVSLLENEEIVQLELIHEGDAAESNNIRFVSFPIPDRGVPDSTPAAVALLRSIAENLAGGQNVAVHCRQSVGRSGLIAAGVLVTTGMAAEKAMDVVSAARGLKVPETQPQSQWIHRLPSAHLVGSPESVQVMSPDT